METLYYAFILECQALNVSLLPEDFTLRKKIYKDHSQPKVSIMMNSHTSMLDPLLESIFLGNIFWKYIFKWHLHIPVIVGIS